jgi:AcrR family transcriptional regulator
MKIEKVKKRDRERTKNIILQAVGEVIKLHGPEKVGVNLIARTAGVNKVLIYRYFDSVDGLMEQYMMLAEYNYKNCIKYIDNIPKPPIEEPGKVLTNLMYTFLTDLRENKANRDLLRWEIGTRKSVVSKVCDQLALRILGKIGNLPYYNDTSALVTFLTAGIYYCVISSDKHEKMLDIDLQSDDGWKRIEKVIERIVADVRSSNIELPKSPSSI